MSDEMKARIAEIEARERAATPKYPESWWLSVVPHGSHWGYDTREEAERAPHVVPHRVVHVVPVEWVDREAKRAEEAERALAELHEISASNNPKPVSPELAAAFRAKVDDRRKTIGDAQAFENVMRALEPVVAGDKDIADVETLWEDWDNARDPHEKAKRQMRLGECVAMLLEDRSARIERAEDGARMRDALFEKVARLRAEHGESLARLTTERDALAKELDGAKVCYEAATESLDEEYKRFHVVETERDAAIVRAERAEKELAEARRNFSDAWLVAARERNRERDEHLATMAENERLRARLAAHAKFVEAVRRRHYLDGGNIVLERCLHVRCPRIRTYRFHCDEHRESHEEERDCADEVRALAALPADEGGG